MSAAKLVDRQKREYFRSVLEEIHIDPKNLEHPLPSSEPMYVERNSRYRYKNCFYLNIRPTNRAGLSQLLQKQKASLHLDRYQRSQSVGQISDKESLKLSRLNLNQLSNLQRNKFKDIMSLIERERAKLDESK